MSAPKRWLDEDGGATAEERAILRAGIGAEPSPDQKRMVWLALAAKIAAGGAAGGAAGAGASGAAAKGVAAAGGKTIAAAVGAHAAGGGLLGAALIGAGCAVAVLTGSTLIENARSLPPAPSAVVATAPDAPHPHAPSGARAPTNPPVADATQPAAPDLAEPSHTPTPAQPAAVASSRAGLAPIAPRPPSAPPVETTATPEAPPAPAPEPASRTATDAPGDSAASGGGAAAVAERTSLLREESIMVARARDALRAGDIGGCFALLEAARTRFPQGMLGQEREALAIEALARSGQRAAAAERAAAFLRAYPSSPHAARVRSFAQ